MYYPRLATAFYETVWAILPAKLAEMETFIRLKMFGGEISAEKIAQIEASRRRDDVKIVGRVAVVPVQGVIAQRMGLLEKASGGIGADELGNTMQELAMDRTVKGICLAFDSPGGSVFGIEELGRTIASIAKEKKVVAVADSIAASAAYWLASQASELVITPGGQVGSIGVIAAHEDRTREMEEQGVKTTLVASSPYKAELDPSMMLSDSARQDLQDKVDHYHGMFVSAVARGRNVSETKVSKDFGQGRMVTARQAVDRGMADKIATLQQTLKRLGAWDEGEGWTSKRPGALAAQRAAVLARAAEVEADLPAGYPLIGAFTHNSTVAENKPEWGKVDKTELPRLAFADPGEEDKKKAIRI